MSGRRSWRVYIAASYPISVVLHHLYVNYVCNESSTTDKAARPFQLTNGADPLKSNNTMTTKTNVSSENFSWLQSISYRLGFFSSATGSSRSGKNPTVLIGHSYNANDPSEDRWLVKSDPANDWDIGCVLDGHGGWQVSDYVSHKIIDLIVKYVLQSNSNLSATSIEERLIGVFEELENSYIQSIRSVYKLGYGEVAKVGSCALVAIRRGKSLTIANAGDCRAVIGTQAKSPSSKDDHKNENRYYATRITMDHNCREPLEDFRLRQAHPNESDIVICKTSHACYVKGRLQLTRALGDVYLKHQEFNAPPTKQSR